MQISVDYYIRTYIAVRNLAVSSAVSTSRRRAFAINAIIQVLVAHIKLTNGIISSRRRFRNIPLYKNLRVENTRLIADEENFIALLSTLWLEIRTFA